MSPPRCDGRSRIVSSARDARVAPAPQVAASVLQVVSGARRGAAQVEITVDPNMVKGAPGAPVTIVEFSDYQ
jgi:hypothetical protein